MSRKAIKRWHHSLSKSINLKNAPYKKLRNSNSAKKIGKERKKKNRKTLLKNHKGKYYAFPGTLSHKGPQKNFSQMNDTFAQLLM